MRYLTDRRYSAIRIALGFLIGYMLASLLRWLGLT